MVNNEYFFLDHEYLIFSTVLNALHKKILDFSTTLNALHKGSTSCPKCN